MKAVSASSKLDDESEVSVPQQGSEAEKEPFIVKAKRFKAARKMIFFCLLLQF